uniref:Cationic amino acid transporter C-terminal domain-containing protein n=1 Tax=Palpitomonas bilix TaxID=652834 RepID=A0A7S3G916_9EUKA|mmetsp:Transcript_29624/g.76535  ORF Transcript_29624/g.76535 Transcript_29624/m.76535 type:complete len:678 (+) Transcript_29624:142-2175(+)|eukprot:CAMPEP_0113887570 /NCGR_PEP_ID=MMETSP0780_2-20120614/12295_1 /TAXON_ID=652834 /ORGANISM="Palpitomonas bilix" /LENGTH=677 /DNA_ID=CAMNT_0000876133 /DNA_START=141 /DNA_END=2174 /DNA_ORIENTATION=- /assembly_acc=CAM_ASM_000599
MAGPRPSFYSRLFRQKDMEKAKRECQESSSGLKKALSAFDLIALGIGCIIGAGIFVLTGEAAAVEAGPSVMLSFLFASIASGFAALSYSEFGANVPVSGSAYSYAMLSIGEFPAWLIGFNLILEYTIGAAAIARGWSGYLVAIFEAFGAEYPKVLYRIELFCSALPSANETISDFSCGDHNITVPDVHCTSHFNSSLNSTEMSEVAHSCLTNIDMTSVLIIVLLTILLTVGIRESSKLNIAVTAINLVIVLFVIILGATKVDTVNYDPFFHYLKGPSGMFSGAATVFFAYIGFDSISTAAEETKNPKRDMPIGVIGSLLVCTVLYVAVAGVITGMQNYLCVDLDAPLARAFMAVGYPWAEGIIAFGAFAGLTTSVLVTLMAQPRIFLAMAHDGLLPAWFEKIHPKFQTPINSQILTGVIAGVIAGVVTLEFLASMVAIGALFAFVFVSAGVINVRYRPASGEGTHISRVLAVYGLACLGLSIAVMSQGDVFGCGMHAPMWVVFVLLALVALLFAFVCTAPFIAKKEEVSGLLAFASKVMHLPPGSLNVPTSFKCPFVPVVPLLGIFTNIYLIVNLGPSAWIRFVVWMAVGILIYFAYGHRHSKLQGKEGVVEAADLMGEDAEAEEREKEEREREERKHTHVKGYFVETEVEEGDEEEGVEMREVELKPRVTQKGKLR